MKTQSKNPVVRTALRLSSIAVVLTTLAACSSSSNDAVVVANCAMLSSDATLGSKALVASRDTGFATGQTEIVTLDGCAASEGAFEATGSDIRVNTDGTSVYQLGASGLDNITKYDVTDPTAALYQYSVADPNAVEGEGANPYQLVFVNEEKAYLIRYDSAKSWIVNPSAQSEAEFKIGELDLSAYDDLDVTPEANSAVIVDGKLFILMERLERRSQFDWVVERTGYVAVFDTSTNEEVDTLMGTADGLKGIPLTVTNASNLQYSAADGMLYLIGRGNSFSAQTEGLNRFTGGIESIDPTSYETNMLLDDGTEEDNNGFMTQIQVTSASQAFVTTSAGWQMNSLFSLNMLTNELSETALSGRLADGMESALSEIDVTTIAAGPGNSLWVGIGGDTPGFSLLNTNDGASMDAFIPTLLVPLNVVFTGQ